MSNYGVNPGSRPGTGRCKLQGVKLRLRPWVVVTLVLALCAGLVFIMGLWRSRAGIAPARLAEYLPAPTGVALGIDVAALRTGGIIEALSGSGIAEEREYQDFVRESGFNWEQDLDYVLARFTPREKYFLLKGRFDWGMLRAYAQKQGGSCRNAFCEMEGSTPERLISFFPLRVDVMALAVGPERGLAWSLAERSGKPAREVPRSPIWLRFRPESLDSDALAPPLKPLLALAEGAEEVQLELSSSAGGFRVLLDVDSASADAASQLAERLQAAVRLLGGVDASLGQQSGGPNLSQVLARGVFEVRGAKVIGYWPIDPSFLEGILGFSR